MLPLYVQVLHNVQLSVCCWLLAHFTPPTRRLHEDKHIFVCMCCFWSCIAQARWIWLSRLSVTPACPTPARMTAHAPATLCTTTAAPALTDLRYLDVLCCQFFETADGCRSFKSYFVCVFVCRGKAASSPFTPASVTHVRMVGHVIWRKEKEATFGEKLVHPGCF